MGTGSFSKNTPVSSLSSSSHHTPVESAQTKTMEEYTPPPYYAFGMEEEPRHCLNPSISKIQKGDRQGCKVSEIPIVLCLVQY